MRKLAPVRRDVLSASTDSAQLDKPMVWLAISQNFLVLFWSYTSGTLPAGPAPFLQSKYPKRKTAKTNSPPKSQFLKLCNCTIGSKEPRIIFILQKLWIQRVPDSKKNNNTTTLDLILSPNLNRCAKSVQAIETVEVLMGSHQHRNKGNFEITTAYNSGHWSLSEDDVLSHRVLCSTFNI